MIGKNNYSAPRSKPLKILFFIAVFTVIAGALSWLIMFLWNNILTDVAGLKPLNFWKAAGILLLSKIIFGGFRRHRGPRNHSKRKEWRHKWMKMSQEERKEAKSKWREHCKKRTLKDKGE